MIQTAASHPNAPPPPAGVGPPAAPAAGLSRAATESAAPAPDLASIRARIDAIDDQLLSLVAQRLALAREVGRLKAHRHLLRAEREAELLARVTAGPVPARVAQALWVQLIAAMLAEEGIAEIVITDERLRLPAMLRFGQVLPVRLEPDALGRAHRHDAITIVPPGTVPPAGCALLMALPDGAGLVIGPDPETAP
jgi:chorismate mutase